MNQYIKWLPLFISLQVVGSTLVYYKLEKINKNKQKLM
jgi:RNA-binding protein YhbY